MKKLYLILASGILIAQGTYAEAGTIENESDKDASFFFKNDDQTVWMIHVDAGGSQSFSSELSKLTTAHKVGWFVGHYSIDDARECDLKKTKALKQTGKISLRGHGDNPNDYYCKVETE